MAERVVDEVKYCLRWNKSRSAGPKIPVACAHSKERLRNIAAHFEWSGWNWVVERATGAIVEGPFKGGAPDRRWGY